MTIIMILTCLLLCACFCRLWWLCYAEYYGHVMHITIIMLRLLLWPCDALYYDHMMPMIMVMLCFLIWPCYAYYYDHGMRIIIIMVCILLCVDGLMRVHVSNHRLLLCWLHQVKRVHTIRSINKHWLQNNHTRTRELVFQTNNQGRVGRTIANACLHLGQMAWKNTVVSSPPPGPARQTESKPEVWLPIRKPEPNIAATLERWICGGNESERRGVGWLWVYFGARA